MYLSGPNFRSDIKEREIFLWTSSERKSLFSGEALSRNLQEPRAYSYAFCFLEIICMGCKIGALTYRTEVWWKSCCYLEFLLILYCSPESSLCLCNPNLVSFSFELKSWCVKVESLYPSASVSFPSLLQFIDSLPTHSWARLERYQSILGNHFSSEISSLSLLSFAIFSYNHQYFY